MADISGSVYGLTILSPIINDPHAGVSHDLQLRILLGTMARDEHSPFAKLSSTHLARLTVLNDVVYVGMPACEEHLQSQYLIFESNFDGDLDTYLHRMASDIPKEVDAVWSHCIGYPGTSDAGAFADYMKRCRIPTTFYFADVNDKTVQQTLRALQTKSAVGAFVERNSVYGAAGKRGAELQRAFEQLLRDLKDAPDPVPGSGLEDRKLCSVAGSVATYSHE